MENVVRKWSKLVNLIPDLTFSCLHKLINLLKYRKIEKRVRDWILDLARASTGVNQVRNGRMNRIS